MKNNIYVYIIIMALVTYLVRVLPLAVFRKEIKSTFVKSFLYYVPYVTLSVMTFPAIITVSGNTLYGLIGFLIAVAVSFIRGSLPLVAVSSCLAVYISSLII